MDGFYYTAPISIFFKDIFHKTPIKNIEIRISQILESPATSWKHVLPLKFQIQKIRIKHCQTRLVRWYKNLIKIGTVFHRLVDRCALRARRRGNAQLVAHQVFGHCRERSRECPIDIRTVYTAHFFIFQKKKI